MKNLITVFFTLLFAACSSDTAPRFTVIQNLRVLDLNLDQPEINYDGTTFAPTSVQMIPWISDIYGNGRPLRQSVSICLDPGVGIGATPTCDGNPTRTEILTDQAVAASPNFLAPNYTGALAAISIPLSSFSLSAQSLISARFNQATPEQRFNGLALLVFYELYPLNGVGERITSFKRLVFSSSAKASKNQNPSGLEIRSQGVEITALPTIPATSVIAYLPPSANETYSIYQSNSVLTSEVEALDTSWLFTGPADISCSKKIDCTPDGFFSLEVTRNQEVNTFNLPEVALPTTRGRVLIAITKDRRGGSVVKRYCDGICP